MRDWKLMKREASLSQNHLSWPFIPSKINLPLMCPYYCTDFNLLQPIKASPPGDTIHSHCVVFHLHSKQWLIKVAFLCSSRTLKGPMNSAGELWKSFAHKSKWTQPKQTRRFQRVSDFFDFLNALVHLYFGFVLHLALKHD